MTNFEDIGAELAEQCRDRSEHTRPVRNGEAERHDAVAALAAGGYQPLRIETATTMD